MLKSEIGVAFTPLPRGKKIRGGGARTPAGALYDGDWEEPHWDEDEWPSPTEVEASPAVRAPDSCADQQLVAALFPASLLCFRCL